MGKQRSEGRKGPRSRPTPGPWTTERPYQEAGLFVSAANSRYTNPLICRVKETEEGLANARLIAAAPDMLHALKTLLANAEALHSFGIPDHIPALTAVAFSDARMFAKDAIAKAGDHTDVTYHNTAVVSFNNSEVILRTDGWKTVTTKTRMNQTSNQFGLGYHVFQKSYDWFIQTRAGVFPFEGHTMLINRKTGKASPARGSK